MRCRLSLLPRRTSGITFKNQYIMIFTIIKNGNDTLRDSIARELVAELEAQGSRQTTASGHINFILAVQEIRGWNKTTAIPNAPDYMLGVINLRGVIVPIIDLRKHFGMPDVEFTASTVVVVVKVAHENGERTVGLVVDAVSDVYQISDEDINKSPAITGMISSQFIKGLANVKDKMVILLTISELINVGVLEEVTAS